VRPDSSPSRTSTSSASGCATILAFGNCAFEIAVVEWMIFDFDREALIAWIE
jgi:hypothetical protein